MKKVIYIIALIFTVSCTDDFREINTDPTVDNNPSLDYVVSEAMRRLSTDSYHRYYYGMLPTTLPMMGYVTQGGTGNSLALSESLTNHRPLGYVGVSNSYRLAEFLHSQLDEDLALRKQGVLGICRILRVYGFLQILELSGELRYSESGLAPYTNPPLLYPKLDTQEEMLDMMIKDLDTSIAEITAEGQIFSAQQDIMYKGNFGKWAKLANSMKLCIADFLLNADREKAFQIVTSVINNEVGYLDDLNDDWFWKGNDDDMGKAHNLAWKPGSEPFINLLKDYKDPRLLWYFTKNDFNPLIIQAFIDNGKPLPPYITDVCNFDSEGNFESFTGNGEPWVRYHGMPITAKLEDKKSAEYEFYFNQAEKCKLKVGAKTKVYDATCLMQGRLFQIGSRFTYPDLPTVTGAAIEGGKNIFRVLYMSSAEVNLILAEFAAYGLNLPKTATEYLKRGAELSIRRVNETANYFKTAYYDGDPYYNGDSGLALKEEWLADYLNTELFDLSTNAKEKVYIQLFTEFYHRQQGHIPLFRRSGIPKEGSAYFGWDNFYDTELPWVRRKAVNLPKESSGFYADEMKSYERQGFTLGAVEPEVLESERYWWDKNNPKAHKGPK